MADRSLSARAGELTGDRVPFVHARVVLAEAPTSAKPGAEALILPDGTIEGFVGGDCAESTVRAQSLALLDSGESLLLRITPTPEDDLAGKLVVHNPCLSGGTLEIFLEPILAAPGIAIVGGSPIAAALADVAVRLGWHADVADDAEQVPSDAISGAAAVVVASHGRGEAETLRAALDADVPYVGLVASRTRGAAVIQSLDMCASHTERIHSPAGLDIGARTPEEVALSIMAEIVSLRPRPSGRQVPEGAEPAGSATDPVCGMTVATVEASLHLDHDGGRRWFCGSGCLRAFASDPGAYAST